MNDDSHNGLTYLENAIPWVFPLAIPPKMITDAKYCYACSKSFGFFTRKVKFNKNCELTFWLRIIAVLVGKNHIINPYFICKI